MSDSPTTTPRPWWQPGPFDYSPIELLVMRASFAAMIWCNIKWETQPYTTQRNPSGLAHFFDFTWLAQHPPGLVWKATVILGLVVYALGRAPAIALAPVCATAVMIGTLVVSKAPHHTWQLITLIALAQWLVYVWPKTASEWWRPTHAVHRVAIYASTVVFAASYVVCGITKLTASHFQWVQNVPYLAVQLLKTNWSSYYDTLEPVPSWLPIVTQQIAEHPYLARLFFGMGLLIELAGLVVLINRQWAFWGGLAIIALHLSISAIMDLHFEYHMLAALVFAVNLPGLKRTFARRDPPVTAV